MNEIIYGSKIQFRYGGIKSKLDGVGIFYWIASIVGFIICIFLSQRKTIESDELSSFWIGFEVITLAQGIIFSIMFKAAAEVVRLLKKLNELPYGGEISELSFGGYKCNECGASVNQNENICPLCGVSFEV